MNKNNNNTYTAYISFYSKITNVIDRELGSAQLFAYCKRTMEIYIYLFFFGSLERDAICYWVNYYKARRTTTTPPAGRMR